MSALQYYFSSQNPNETIIRILHRHWFNLIIQLIPAFVMCAIMISSFVLYPYLFSGFTDDGMRIVFFFINSFLFLLMWIYCFVIWFDYYLDIWIMTSERIVNVEQKGLFSRQVSELKYRMIQDVSTDVHGFFPTLFNFGDVTVQTAAEQSRFKFKAVGNPYQLKADIVAQQKKRLAEQGLVM